jgi:predicted phage terminase large subunit-like protein
MYPISALDSLQKSMDPYAIAGQYQQRPVGRRGGLFDGALWQYVDRAPNDARKIRAWDFAHTAGGGDWTCGVLLSESGDEDDRKLFIEHVERGQWDSFGVEKVVKATAHSDGPGIPVCIPEDPSAGKSLANNIKVRLLRGFTVYSRAPRADKVTRATPIATQAKAGNVFLVRGTWNQALVEEARMFPRGRTKDQIDALADAFAELVEGKGGTADGIGATLDDYRRYTKDPHDRDAMPSHGKTQRGSIPWKAKR